MHNKYCSSALVGKLANATQKVKLHLVFADFLIDKSEWRCEDGYLYINTCLRVKIAVCMCLQFHNDLDSHLAPCTLKSHIQLKIAFV